MSTIAKVQARGQVTVPQEIREAYGIEPGSELLFLRAGKDHFECRVLPKPRSLIEFIKQHKIDGPPIDVEQLLKEAEEEAAGEVIRRLARNRE